ncbi:hypothetical protein L504_2941 [Bordetella bronchiseptica F2]|nr:hypothetical protein L542_2929 [Bordetella bronchiseptica F-1]KDC24417.1 hypothetical protein L504_2941 [Bordetella bronchiseptica F2]
MPISCCAPSARRRWATTATRRWTPSWRAARAPASCCSCRSTPGCWSMRKASRRAACMWCWAAAASWRCAWPTTPITCGRSCGASRPRSPRSRRRRPIPSPASIARSAAGAWAAKRAASPTTIFRWWPACRASRPGALTPRAWPRWRSSAPCPSTRRWPASRPARCSGCARRPPCNGAPASMARATTSCWRRRTRDRAAWRACPARTPATCSSTWRAIRSRTAASSTCSACMSSTTAPNASCRSGPTTGARRSRRSKPSWISWPNGCGATPMRTSITMRRTRPRP